MTEDRLTAIRARLAAVNGKGLFSWFSVAALLQEDLPWLLEHADRLEKDLQALVDDFAVVSPEEEREVERLTAEVERLHLLLECEPLSFTKPDGIEWGTLRRWLGLTPVEGAKWYQSTRARGRELVQRKRQEEKSR